ncbi:unnamed protein product [Cuscuta europaea]|uniref:Uncharacterized protein n=1 Tax=Cuscuta europaea TaxID=41803 RepID=A0A9P0ZXT9_CUSEU|nr:unnamed protein product [Cuscuta europaea]
MVSWGVWKARNEQRWNTVDKAQDEDDSFIVGGNEVRRVSWTPKEAEAMGLRSAIQVAAERGKNRVETNAMLVVSDKLEQQLQELEHHVASLKTREQRYRKAFLARCHSLHFAENEVDLLGDQVESLLQFLEKIYRKLSKNSSILSCHFEVTDIVRLIKKEIADTIVCTNKINS